MANGQKYEGAGGRLFDSQEAASLSRQIAGIPSSDNTTATSAPKQKKTKTPTVMSAVGLTPKQRVQAQRNLEYGMRKDLAHGKITQEEYTARLNQFLGTNTENQNINQENASQQNAQQDNIPENQQPSNINPNTTPPISQTSVTTTQPASQQQTPVSTYQGNSVVDYLRSIGQSSDFNSRANIAKQQGIQNYTGTAEQNTQILQNLRSRNGTVGGGAPSVIENATAGMTTPRADTTAPPSLTGNPQLDSLYQQLQDVSPQKSFAEVYKETYKSLGIDTIKRSYDEQVKAQSDLQNKKNDEIQEINNNPWFSEGVRVQKLQQLDKKYEGRELILQNQIKLLENNITEARDEAQFISGQTMTQLNKSAELRQDMILKAIDLVESSIEAESKLSGPSSVQEYQYAVQNGYTGTFSQYQNEDANRKISIARAGVGGTGLTPTQINSTVNSIAGAFDNEPVVKEYNTIKAYVDTFNTLGTSSSDDQARIYAFAKVMDPNSVVRESEYATVQAYSQALLRTAGINLARVFTATGTLTPEARSSMSRTLQTRLNAQQSVYNQVSNEYQRQINDTYSGKPRQITNYSSQSVTPLTTSQTETPQVQGFWSRVGDFLFGNE